MAIGSEADRRAEVRRIDPQRVKRRPLDRRDAWIRAVAGVAEVTLIDRGAAAEFRIEPHLSMRVVSFHGCCERRSFDTNQIGQRLDAGSLDQFSAFDVSL